MTAHEDEVQAIVGNRVHVALLLRSLLGRQRPRELLELLHAAPLTTEPVERSVARHRHDPRARVRGDAVARPAGERDEEGLLHRVLGEVDIAERPHERRDRPPRLLAEEAGDRPVLERRYRSTSGLTSTLPRSAAGIRAANSIASSRLPQSTR